MGLTTAKASGPYHIINRQVGTIIECEDQPTGVQLKRKAKLPPVIGLTNKHAVCCITSVVAKLLYSQKSF